MRGVGKFVILPFFSFLFNKQFCTKKIINRSFKNNIIKTLIFFILAFNLYDTILLHIVGSNRIWILRMQSFKIFDKRVLQWRNLACTVGSWLFCVRHLWSLGKNKKESEI